MPDRSGSDASCQTLSSLAERTWSVLATTSTPIDGSSSVLVAFSGGVDSTVLLRMLVELRQAGRVSSVSAVHVHHGLSPNADDWAAHCQTVCDQWQVPVSINHVSVGKGLGDGIEQAARDCRYKVFERELPHGGYLLQGHHRDDQAETVLFRLFRGSGLDGLTGIPVERALGQGTLIRPLLRVSRAEIEAYAAEHQLPFIEDESNADERFARNYLRQRLIPDIERRWPGFPGRLAALADEMLTVQQYLEPLVEAASNQVLQPAPDYWNAGTIVHLNKLLPLSDDRAIRVIRHWFQRSGLLMPDRSTLDTLFSEVIHAQYDAEPRLLVGQHEIRRFDGFLVIVPVLDAFAPDPVVWECQSGSTLSIPGSGLLTVSDCPSDSQPLSVYFRQNVPSDNKIRVHGRTGSKTLKRWLQEYRVPPWLRDRVPLVFEGDRMLGAAGLWCNNNQVTLTWRFDP